MDFHETWYICHTTVGHYNLCTLSSTAIININMADMLNV
jgi:hypothetical protein